MASSFKPFEQYFYFSKEKNVELLQILQEIGLGAASLSPLIIEYQKGREDRIETPSFVSAVIQYLNGYTKLGHKTYKRVEDFFGWVIVNKDKGKKPSEPPAPPVTYEIPFMLSLVPEAQRPKRKIELAEKTDQLVMKAYDLERNIKGPALARFERNLSELEVYFWQDYPPPEKQEAFGNLTELIEIKELSPARDTIVRVLTTVGGELLKAGQLKNCQHAKFQEVLTKITGRASPTEAFEAPTACEGPVQEAKSLKIA